MTRLRRFTVVAIVAGAIALPGAVIGAMDTVAAGCPPSTADGYAQAVLADSPVGYYRLDEAAGPTLCDASTANNPGTYAPAGITYGQAGALHGTSDTAISADGSVNPAKSTGNSSISGATDFTLEGWFKTTTKQDQAFVSIGQSGNQNMAGIGPWSNSSSCCGGNKDLITFDTFGGSFKFDASAVGINVFDGQWHYAVVTFATGSGTATVYLDNHNLGTASVADHPSASPVRIGYWIDTVFNQPFNGGIDEVAVYKSTLSSGRVGAHYAAALASVAASPSPAPALPRTGAATPASDPTLPVGALLSIALVAPLGWWALRRTLRRSPQN